MTALWAFIKPKPWKYKVTARAVLIEPKIKRRVKEDVLRRGTSHRTVGAKNAAANVYE